MTGLDEPWRTALHGAGVGAALGAAVAVANFFIKQQANQVADLKIEAPTLCGHRELSLLISKFTPLRDLSDRTRDLYDTMVTSCDYVLEAEQRKVTGAEQLAASRAALATVSGARALCREAAKLTQRGVKCAADPFEAMRDIETLEGLVNNHLHNIMLG